jgi:arylsulfatase A-like enzyme
VVVFCDDLGYGDLGSFGHPTIRTPELDRMAREGMKWTSFYCAAPVCTPSRAGLLTGRLPIRSGMSSNKRGVLFPNSGGGLPDGEVTIAELLKTKGYATACIGKWHLGHLPEFLPMRHGFDEYFGVPYSNDMSVKGRGDPPIPLLRGEEIVEAPVDQTTLTRRYTEESIAFIERNAERPFFLYLAHTFPHIPLFASDEFQTSPRGLYGDVVEELDWSVGRILDTLRRLHLDEQTLVVFTSDNGPWLVMKLRGGSAGPLREGKGTTFEGGMRVPTITWWPGTIDPGRTTQAMGSTLDLLATFAALADAPLPDDRVLDSHDLSTVLRGAGESPRQTMFFYRGTRLQAVRSGQFKAHYWTLSHPYSNAALEERDPLLLYRLDRDPGEHFDIAGQHPDVLASIAQITAVHQRSLIPVINQLEIPLQRR